MRVRLATSIIAALIVTFIVTYASEYTTQLTVTVNVQPYAIIDVNPKSFSFSGNPGSIADPSDSSIAQDSSTQSYYLTITNLGSVDILNVKVRAELPTNNPWGAGDYSLHKSSEFSLISNSTTGDFYYVAQRLWNFSMPVYIKQPSDCATTQCNFYILRTAETDGQDWFIIAIRGNNDFSNGRICVATSPRTTTSTGTTDFSGCTAINLNTISGYGYTFLDLGTWLKGYFVINSTGEEAYFAYWDSNVLSKIGITNYLCPGDSSNPCLRPSQSKDLRLQVRIPFGVPAGSISGNLYIIATTA